MPWRPLSHPLGGNPKVFSNTLCFTALNTRLIRHDCWQCAERQKKRWLWKAVASGILFTNFRQPPTFGLMGKKAIRTFYTPAASLQQTGMSPQGFKYRSFWFSPASNSLRLNFVLIHVWCWYCRAALFWRTKHSSTQDVSWACPLFDKVQNHPAAYSVKGLFLCENPFS